MKIKPSRKTWLILGLMLALAVFAVACQPSTSPDQTEVLSGGVDLTAASLDTFTVGTGLGMGVFWLLLALGAAGAVVYFLPQILNSGRRFLPRALAGISTFAVIMVLAVPLFGYTKIDAGEVGVVLRQGRALPTALRPGPHTFIPFLDQVVVMSTRPFTYITLGDPVNQGEEEYKDWAVDVVTSDGVQVQVKYTVQGRLNPDRAVEVYSDYGSLENAIEQRLKNPSRVIVRQALQGYEAKALINAVDAVQETVSGQIGDQMDIGGLELIFFGFRKPTLGVDGQYELLLDNTAAAIQEQRLQTEQVKVEEQLALQEIARAEGEAGAELARRKADADAELYAAEQDAAAVRVAADARAYEIEVEATAQADANLLIAASISPELTTFLQWTQTWDGELPLWMTEGGGPEIVIPVEPVGQP